MECRWSGDGVVTVGVEVGRGGDGSVEQSRDYWVRE